MSDPLGVVDALRAVADILGTVAKAHADFAAAVKEAEFKLRVKVEALQPSAPPDKKED